MKYLNFKNKIYKKALNNMDNISVVVDDCSYTYNDLIEMSKLLNFFFSERYKNQTIGLFFDKSFEYILAVFYSIISNNSFMPLDCKLPNERINFMVENNELNVVLTSKKIINNYNFFKNVDVVFIEDILNSKSKKEFDNFLVKQDELAYVIYTSGSTGTPKGVMISYNGINNIISQQVDIFNMNNSKFYLYLNISFDASLSDILCSFLSASTIFINDKIKKDLVKLVTYFNENKITHSDLPPSILKYIDPENSFLFLDTLVVGGEVADFSVLRSFAKKFNLISVYGPTEVTICTNYKKVDEKWNKPYIGNNIKNVNTILIQQENENEFELGLQGCQLFLGYVKNKELNNKSLVEIDGKITYLTGDIVFLDENKEIIFSRRKDRQIKNHGQLVNLNEIEKNLKEIPEVLNASVIFKNNKLYAYYDGRITDKEIRIILGKKLTSYMIPTFIFNKEIPKSSSEKNDFSKLKMEDSTNDEINMLKVMFNEILETNQNISINDSFTKDLGGDSLNFMALHVSLSNIGFNIDFDYLIENDNIKGILNYRSEKRKINTSFLINEYKKIDLSKIKVRKINKTKMKNVVLTGSTGFLGLKILEKLTNDINIEKVYCIVRSNKKESGKQRLLSMISNKFSNKKIIVINGDLSLSNFGLDEKEYQNLANNTDTIIHCAADVNNIKSFENLYNSNILSTINIAKFMFDGCDKNLHYASTLSVCVSSSNLINSKENTTFYEDNLCDNNTEILSGYAQSKWLSEYILSEINKISNSVSIYRFGLLTDNVNFDYCLNEKSFLIDFIKESYKIGKLPKTNKLISMDITPIDLAVEHIFKLFKLKNKIYNVSTNKKLSLSDIIKFLELEEVSVEKWFDEYSTKKIAQYLPEINPYENKRFYNMNLFETTNVKEFYSELPMPNFDFENYKKNLFEKYK